ncbi:MAG: tetratricopeptide repeat protein [Treponemataceae bacterium]|nr:tetratricopeptide repeat protein [Treponemataceae bacterium]
MKKAAVLCLGLIFFACFMPVFGQASFNDALLPGLEAYAREDWATSIMLFKKAYTEKRAPEEESLFWLVMAQMSAGETRSALNDCNAFLAKYAGSEHGAEVAYQRGRALYLLDQNDEAIKQLYDFVKANPNHEKVSFALFWIAESLYGYKNYERAALFYKMIVDDYSASPKREASLYRLELIQQRQREEELLQLLKITHEESLKAAEEYEKKSRSYEQAIAAYQRRIFELENQLSK